MFIFHKKMKSSNTSWFAAPARLDDIAKMYKHTQRIELGKREGERITNKYYICIQVILSKSKSWWRKSTHSYSTRSRACRITWRYLAWCGLAFVERGFVIRLEHCWRIPKLLLLHSGVKNENIVQLFAHVTLYQNN